MKILIIGAGGYIGSALTKYLYEEGYWVSGIDLEWYGEMNPDHLKSTFIMDYADFPDYDLYDVIILLAGHSSVKMCELDPRGSFHNNVSKFIDLIYKLKPHQRFLYASSASIYCKDKQSHYDLQKLTLDKIIEMTDLTYFGLRFGTVCGTSPNPRLELIINSMVYDAITGKKVIYSNGEAYKSILDISDLCRAIKTIIDHLDPPRGIYDLCSYSAQVKDFAEQIASTFSAKLINMEGTSSTYSFTLNPRGFYEKLGFYPEVTSWEKINTDNLRNLDKFKFSRNYLPPCTKN